MLSQKSAFGLDNLAIQKKKENEEKKRDEKRNYRENKADTPSNPGTELQSFLVRFSGSSN